ncbi:MAG: DnaD domain protein [Clostridiales bacterium]|nr:DnaD domain protein [Clostridiales bacterium]
MDYKINPSAFSAIFPVPSSVVDEHIRLAGAVQLKTLLCLLRHANEEYGVDDISNALGLDKADIIDALQYWIQLGIITRENGKDSENVVIAPVINKTVEEKTIEAAEKKELNPIAIAKPTPEEILTRVNESKEIAYLYNEAQMKLGRTIGYADQSSLLMMHDQYGLPVEVIIMIIGYAVSQGKNSINYILKIGKDWGEKEIDTLEKAEERIKELTACQGLWVKFKEYTGISTPKPTAKQTEFLMRWNVQLGYGIDMICMAYEEMANHTDKISFPYIDRIITSWYEQGLHTKQQVERYTNEYKLKKQTSNQTKAKKSEASYDLNEFNKQMYSVPQYKKEG